MLGFLVKVMRKMNFGDNFTSWITMLHDESRTRFILSDLTVLIELLFSIRQGDPLAMLLSIYCTYIAFASGFGEEYDWVKGGHY